MFPVPFKLGAIRWLNPGLDRVEISSGMLVPLPFIETLSLGDVVFRRFLRPLLGSTSSNSALLACSSFAVEDVSSLVLFCFIGLFLLPFPLGLKVESSPDSSSYANGGATSFSGCDDRGSRRRSATCT